MKRLITAFFIVGFAATIASADWLANFKDTYQNQSIDIAVENAMKEGIGPDIIVENALAIETLNPQNLIKAMYCAGVSGRDIYLAADKFQVSELIVAAGFKKSVEECGDRVTDVQPYTPGNQGRGRGFGGPPNTPRGRPFASPMSFQ
jgi:hypothetical protein